MCSRALVFSWSRTLVENCENWEKLKSLRKPLFEQQRRESSRYVKHFPSSPQEEAEEVDDHIDSGTIVKVGDGNDNTMIVNTASSVQSQDTMIVNSEAGTLLESDLGTMVINSDEDEDATMKSRFWKNVVMLNVKMNNYLSARGAEQSTETNNPNWT